MPKYDMLCEDCGQVEIEHSMHEDHPDRHSCGARMKRYFGNLGDQPITYKGTGGIDDWTRQRVDPQQPTSPESDVKYH